MTPQLNEEHSRIRDQRDAQEAYNLEALSENYPVSVSVSDFDLSEIALVFYHTHKGRGCTMKTLKVEARLEERRSAESKAEKELMVTPPRPVRGDHPDR